MKKFFFSSLLLIVFSIIIFISLNSDFRRSMLNLSSGLVNNYYSIMIKKNLGSNSGISKSIKILENQIVFTDYITTNQKNSFIDNIYFNLYMIENNLTSEDDLIVLSNIVKKIIAKDPNVYDALIWNAKLMSIENKQVEKIYDTIDAAINLSPASDQAYRFAIDFSKKNKDQLKVKKYCEGFHASLLGSRNIKNNISKFSESSLTRFAIEINSEQKKEIYIIEGTNLNTEDYFIDFKQPIELSQFMFLSNFFPGTLIDFIQIELRNSRNETIKIPMDDLYIIAKDSFFIKNEGTKKIMANSHNDEKIKFKLNSNFKNINQLKLKIKLSKANITNIPNC